MRAFWSFHMQFLQKERKIPKYMERGKSQLFLSLWWYFIKEFFLGDKFTKRNI